VCLVQCPLLVMTTIMMTMVVMVMIIVVFITMIISLVQCTLLTLVRVVVDTCPQLHRYTTPSFFAHLHPGASFACVSFGGKCNIARLSSSGGCQLFEIGDCHSSSTHSVFYYLFPRDDTLGRNLKKRLEAF